MLVPYSPAHSFKYDSVTAHMFLSPHDAPATDDPLGYLGYPICRITMTVSRHWSRSLHQGQPTKHIAVRTVFLQLSLYEDVPIWIAYASFSSLANVILAQDELFEIKTVAERLSRVY